MSLTNKDKALEIKAKSKEKKAKGKVADPIPNSPEAQDFQDMINKYHSIDMFPDNEIELAFLEDQKEQITDGKSNMRGTWNNSLPTFSPSGVSECERGLAFKILKADQDEQIMEPYQKRWVKNGSAIHERTQKDFLYMEKIMKDAPFHIMRTKDGKPAWERNTRTVKQFTHNGKTFQIYGMVDGVLWDNVRNKRVGYDFKTKSTTIAVIGDYKMKAPQDNNIQQMVAYSLLFDVDEYLIHYESLAKDSWSKGKEARSDIRVFHVTITDEMKTALLDKLAGIVSDLDNNELPLPDFNKCLFCKYKNSCALVEDMK